MLTISGVSEPNRMAIPNRIKIMPKYIGCRLIRKTPVVISFDDFSKGLTVVCSLLNVVSAIKFRTIPTASGTTPIRFQGYTAYIENGIRKCNRAIITIERNK